jgi:Protein of unknown function (DUF3293)
MGQLHTMDLPSSAPGSGRRWSRGGHGARDELGKELLVEGVDEVLQVEQLQGDPRPPPLGVDPGAVRGGTLPLPRHLGPAVEPALQDVVRQRLDLGPVQPSPGGPREHAGDCAEPQPRLWATARWGSSRAHFCRRISRICRMDSRSAAIAAFLPAWADGALDHPAPLSQAPTPVSGAGCLFTFTDLRVHHPDPGVHHDRSGRSRCPNLRVHVGVIPAFSFDRYAQFGDELRPLVHGAAPPSTAWALLCALPVFRVLPMSPDFSVTHVSGPYPQPEPSRSSGSGLAPLARQLTASISYPGAHCRWDDTVRARGTPNADAANVTVPDTLLEAYRKTAFNADTPKGRLSLRIGQRCLELDELLTEHGVSTWAYVTAFNPGSMQLLEKENAIRHHELEADVASLGVTSYLGEGVADDGRWPPEASLLILGIRRGDAVRLGRQYGQLAVVCGDFGGAAELVLCTDG